MAGFHFNCPHCAQDLETTEGAAGLAVSCPNCGQEIQVPVHSQISAGNPVCGVCLSPIAATEAKTFCPACKAEYHSECWEENGGCGVYGCSQVPVVEKRQAIEIPISYWGQEKKRCPKCQHEILAAAVRCRHCGATFDSARPQNAEEFQQRTELTGRLPATRRTIVWLFVFSVVPCLAPIGAVWGLVWFPAHREDVRLLPTLYGALCKIGLIVAIAQTIAVVVLTVLFVITRH
jgi:transcription elongation factor Elf1